MACCISQIDCTNRTSGCSVVMANNDSHQIFTSLDMRIIIMMIDDDDDDNDDCE